MTTNAERSAKALANAAARQINAQVAHSAAMELSQADLDKLDGIEAEATKNDTDANLRARASHTGTQLASTISDFADTVRATVLTGLSLASAAAITAADTVLAALGKLQVQITDAASNLAANVRATVLTGLSLTTGTAITAADTVLSAFGKLQKQITDLTVTPNGFSAHKNGTVQNVTAFTVTKLTFSTKFFDTNTEFDTSTSRYTPKQPGTYWIVGAVFNVASNDQDYLMVRLYKNGAQIANGGVAHASSPAGGPALGLSAAFIVQANGTTDYFEIYTYINRTQNIEGVTGTTGFSGVRVGA